MFDQLNVTDVAVKLNSQHVPLHIVNVTVITNVQ